MDHALEKDTIPMFNLFSRNTVVNNLVSGSDPCQQLDRVSTHSLDCVRIAAR